MSRGKVKWYDVIKGFGFIEKEDGKSIFVHRAGLQNPVIGLVDGQEVAFEIRPGDRGDVAYNVK